MKETTVLEAIREAIAEEKDYDETEISISLMDRDESGITWIDRS